MTVSVIGLGHLGLPLAALLAACGHRVWGVDSDPAHVARLQHGDVGWHEPGLAALCRSAETDLLVTTDAAAAATASEVSIIAVPTPSGADGSYDPTHVLEAASRIGDALRRHDRPHVVVVLSTVMPGTLDGPVGAVLRARSGRPIGPLLGLCYCPAFGAIGSLLEDYRQPDFLLMGQSDPAAGSIAAAVFAAIHRNRPPLLRRTLLDAELAKITLNNFMIAKLSFATMIGNLCEQIPGADAAQVLSVLGHDRRIGAGFLRAAMPYGGPCFVRDVSAIEALARRHGVAVPLATVSETINAAHHDAIVEALRAATPEGGAIAVLGLAFRHGTDVALASPGLAIAGQLGRDGYRVSAWDPMARPEVGEDIRLADTLAGCVHGADTVLIANDDPLCAELPDLRRGDGTAVVVFDYWHRLAANGRAQRFDIRRFGQWVDAGGAVPAAGSDLLTAG